MTQSATYDALLLVRDCYADGRDADAERVLQSMGDDGAWEFELVRCATEQRSKGWQGREARLLFTMLRLLERSRDTVVPFAMWSAQVNEVAAGL